MAPGRNVLGGGRPSLVGGWYTCSVEDCGRLRALVRGGRELGQVLRAYTHAQTGTNTQFKHLN